jgi:hypothetical protein
MATALACLVAKTKSTLDNRMRSTTISAEYLALQMHLHENPNYGVASLSYAPLVADIMRKTGAKSLSDYGAGKCNLQRGLASCGLVSLSIFHTIQHFQPMATQNQPTSFVASM